MQNQSEHFIWIMLVVIALMIVVIIGMLLRMWRHEWKESGSDFYRRQELNDEQ